MVPDDSSLFNFLPAAILLCVIVTPETWVQLTNPTAETMKFRLNSSAIENDAVQTGRYRTQATSVLLPSKRLASYSEQLLKSLGRSPRK